MNKFNLFLNGFILAICFLTIQESQAQCTPKLRIVTECDNNGTPCDPSDDFHVVSAYMFVNHPGRYTATINGVPYGPFDINTHRLEVIGEFPANGQVLCITFTDIDDPLCTGMLCSDPLIPCPVSIDLEVIEYICNDNGTANDPTDDYYEVKVIVRMSMFLPDHRAGYMIDVAGSTYGPFRYGSISTFEVPADGGVHQVVAYDELDPICTDMEPIGPLTPCSVPCAMAPQVISMECFDNGTPSPIDDFYKIKIMANAVVHGLSGTYDLDADFLPPLTLAYGKVFEIILPARGKEVTLTFTDSDYWDCWDEIIIGPLDHCSELCEVLVDSLDYTCFDNNTPDPSDDYYLVAIRVSGHAAGAGYEMSSKGVQYGPYKYDSLITFTLPADGDSYTFLIKDLDFPKLCKTNATIGPLDHCSKPCEMVILEQEIKCNDNATTEITDDFYDINLKVDEPNARAGDQFEVIIDGTVYGPYDYGDDVAITLPADSRSFTVYIRDVRRGTTCELTLPIGPLVPCSSDCTLELEASNIQCHNAGTGIDPSDDTFTFDLVVNGQNVGAQWQADDALNTTANYGVSTTFGPYLISNGNIVLTIQDLADPYCRDIIVIQPPAPCSDSCYLDLVDVVYGDCDDNNTGNDKTDDSFFVEINVQGGNSGSGYTIEWEGNTSGPHNYNEYIRVEPISANGVTHTIVVKDADFDYCILEIDVSMDPCSECTEDGNAGNSATLSCSVDEVQLTATATSGGDYEWTGPGNQKYSGPKPKVDVAGWYHLLITFPNGCTVMDSVEVLSDTTRPVAIPLDPQVLTCARDSVTLDIGGSTQGNDIVYFWTNEAGDTIGVNQSMPVTLPGVYCLDVVDTARECGSGRRCLQVEQDITPPEVYVFVDPDNVLNCKIDSVRLSMLKSPNTKHVWTFRTNQFLNETIWIRDTGMVYITVTDTMNGCTSMRSIRISSLLEYPIVNVDDPPPLTCKIKSIEIDATGSQQGQHVFYQWYDENEDELVGENGNKLVVDAPGTYFFEVVDTINGCTNIDTVVVDEVMVFHQIDAGDDDELRCDVSLLNLDGKTTSSLNDVIIDWQTSQGKVVSGSDRLNPEVEGEGMYIVSIEDKATGCLSTDTVLISRAIPPELETLSGDEVCLDESDGWIEIEQIIKGQAPYKRLVNGQEFNGDLVSDLQPGTYEIKIIDDKGCEVDTTITINEGRAFAGDFTGNIRIVQGDTTTLIATATIPASDIASITWEANGTVVCDNCSQIQVSPDEETEYIVTIVDKYGCQTTVLLTVYVKDDNRIWAPNIFTPDGDNVNDIFNLHGKNLVLVEKLLIFDRWGELMFQTENIEPDFGWDGTLNGELMNPAVFVYYAIGVFKDGTKAELYGDVTLVK